MYSGLALNSVRAIIKSISPEGTFQQFYSITSGVVIIVMCLGWSPIPQTVWSFSNMPLLYYTVTGMLATCSKQLILAPLCCMCG